MYWHLEREQRNDEHIAWLVLPSLELVALRSSCLLCSFLMQKLLAERQEVAHMCAACAKGAYKASETCHWRRNEGGKGWEAFDYVYQRNEIFLDKLIRSRWLTMSCHWLWPIQSSTTAAVLSTCSSGNRRPCKEDEDSCALMCLVGLRLQAFNERQILYDDNCYTF